MGSDTSVFSLSKRVGQMLRERSLSVATAESCTGGGLAARIVAVSGSSDYFVGGIVAYANEAKTGVLGVTEATLREVGAVSWQTAVQMAQGARRLFGTDLSLSTTGIAGPTGGTPAKPVGTVYIALAIDGYSWWQHHVWAGTRAENIQQSELAALTLLARYLECDGPLSDWAIQVGADGKRVDTLLPLDVKLSAGPDDRLRPSALEWRGHWITISSWGRTWVDEQGGKHFLVMSRSHGTFELLQDHETGSWWLKRAWEQQHLV